jgi:hypothetical protein
MKTEVGVRGFFIFFLLFSPKEAPTKEHGGRSVEGAIHEH